MATIDRRGTKWCARWRAYPGGPQQRRTFDRKIDAEQFLTKIKHDLMVGSYVKPSEQRVTLADYAARWLDRMRPTWRPSTAATVTNTLDKHVLPVLGRRPLSIITRADVEALCASLALAPSTVGVVHQHLGQLLGGAVEDGLIVRNPAHRARLPRREATKARPVPLDVVERIAAELPDWQRIVVPLGIGAGLRQGEMSGLTVDRIDFLRRRLTVDRQLVSRAVAEAVLAPTKTSSSNRTIPLADFVLEALAEHLRVFPRSPGELVLLSKGKPVDSDTFGHYWRRAVKAAGAPGLRYHDLRHTFASTLLSRGVSVKAVSLWLGHASPVITLQTYAHLMPADEDVARGVLDAALNPINTTSKEIAR
jgi:integrase